MATISRAIAEAEALGYHVVGAMNSDYFSTSTGVPIGIVIEDGIYKSSTSVYSAVAFIDNKTVLIDDPMITMSLTNTTKNSELNIPHLNKFRTAGGGLYLLNDDYSDVSTRTSGAGWAVRMEVTSENTDLTVNGELTLTVTETSEIDGSVPIGKDNYILTAATAAGMNYIYESFTVGDQITIKTTPKDSAIIDAQWATGVGDVMIDDGKVTNSEDWQHTKTGRAPRTAMGVLEDGTTVLYVVDGRRYGYSAGLSQVELADELLDQGCVWAVNLDGGGSSNMSVLQPGQSNSTVVNRPSDGRNRPAATFILLVSEDKGTDSPHTLALKHDGAVVIKGGSVTLSDAVAVNDVGITLSDTPDDITYTSNSLGSMQDKLYTAGNTSGTDIISLSSENWNTTGTAQVHVVNSLTNLTITRADNNKKATNLTMQMGQTVDLNATGSYWDRPALHTDKDVTWTFTPKDPNFTGVLGTIDELGVFTAGSSSGTITATAGGLARSIFVSLATVQTDVPSTHWSYDAVTYCYANNIISGISPTEFGLGRDITRGDFVLILYKALGQPKVESYTEFSDVKSTDYYAPAISWAVGEGLASGVSDGIFAAKHPITREQAFTILNKALPLMDIDVEAGNLGVLKHFTDGATVASYAQQPTATLVTHRIVSGANDKINPRGSLSREEMASLMYKLANYNPDSITPIEPPAMPATAITLNRTDFILLPGEGFQLTASLTPSDSTEKVIWTSSDPSAASITENGTVTNVFQGIGQPTVTITATAGDITATCVVRCRPVGDEGTEIPPIIPPINPEPPVEPPVDPPIAPPTSDVKGTVVNAVDGLNLRGGPGSSFEIIGSVANGTEVYILKTLDDWYHVTAQTKNNGTITGYLSSNYIQLIAPPTPDPVPPVTPPTTPTQEIPHLTGTIINAESGLNLRAEPNSSGKILYTVNNSSEVSILKRLDGWYHVSTTTADGTPMTGYLSSSYVKIPSLGTVTNATQLNVRAGAGSEHAILTGINEGAIVPVLATENDWYKIIVDVNGTAVTGYVSTAYLTLT